MKSVEQVHAELDFWGFLNIGHHGVIHTPIGDLNLKTLVMTWVVMIIIGLVTMLATRNMRLDRPCKPQLIMEEIFLFLRRLVYENIDYKKGAGLMCLIFTIFIFILFSNLWGLVPTMMSPTADLNTTMGMALLVFILVQVLGVRYRGGKYFKHFLEPIPYLLPLTIVEEFSKLITLPLRLYGNIYAGEVLIAVLLGLFGATLTFLGGFIPSVVWLSFSIFIGLIQAFIFTILSIAYISKATAEHH